METMMKMKRKSMIKLAVPLLFLLLFLILSAACQNNTNLEYHPDGDMTDGDEAVTDGDVGDNPDLEVIQFKGTSSEGNPARILVGFDVIEMDSQSANIDWSRLSINLDNIFLADSASCDSTSGELLGTSSVSLEISLLSDNKFLLDIAAPAERDFCAIDFRLNTDSPHAPFVIEGTTEQGEALSIAADLNGSILFPSPGAPFRWTEGQELRWLMTLNEGDLLPDDLLSRIVPDEEGVLRVDQEHNSELLDEINESVATSFLMISDENANGQADAGEVADPVSVGDPEGLPDGPPSIYNRPYPIIEIPEEDQNPEPLDVIHLDGRNSLPPFSGNSRPFEYFWEWIPSGKPAHAEDAVLIPSTGNFDIPHSIMGDWTEDGYPKIYLPIAGSYGIRLKIRDSDMLESEANENCPDCKEWAEIWIDVRPSQKLHVELVWDRGDDVDLDLFLVRFRPDGTFAVPAPFQDKVIPTTASMGACTEDADCFGGAFTCGPDDMCINECQNDDECKAVDPGWFCNEYDECQKNEDDIIECESDEDCRGNGYCNPSKVGLSTYKMICTKHDGESLFDTCSHINKNPRWGEYEEVNMSCVDDLDCNGVGSDTFTCEATRCTLACENSSECLALSDQFLCGGNSSCIGNSVDDDPTLEIDDVNGWGPENISLKDPISGRYRIVVRLYADPLDVVSDDGPLSPVKAYVHIYLNGEIAMAKNIAHELTDTNIYWKVADILWDENAEGGEGAGTAEPLCAGWTQTPCSDSLDCSGWYGEDYSCATRDWGKFCSICANGEGTPEECAPTNTSCNSNTDCAGESSAKTCALIKGDYCSCSGSNPFGEFEQDPYANPFHTSGGTLFDPNGSATRSMWCDSATMSSHSVPGSGQVDILSDGAACSTLYQ